MYILQGSDVVVFEKNIMRAWVCDGLLVRFNRIFYEIRYNCALYRYDEKYRDTTFKIQFRAKSGDIVFDSREERFRRLLFMPNGAYNI